MRGLNILVISNLYPPNAVGGYEQLCFDVTSELVRRGHAITVLTSDWGSQAAEYPGQQVHRDLHLLVGDSIYEPFPGDAAERIRRNSANIEALNAVIERLRPNVIFAWNLFFLDRALFDTVMRSGIRVVLVLTDNWLLAMHDADFTANYFKSVVYGDSDPKRSRKALRIAARAKRLLANLLGAPKARPRAVVDGIAVYSSEFMRAFYRAGGLYFRQERIVHNGVRLRSQPSSVFRDRSRLVRANELRLLFAGRITEIKGTHTALEALVLLRSAKPDVERVRLTILGDATHTAYLSRLQGLVEKYGLASDVDFHAPVPEDMLFQLFQDHDIYVFPSLYEPFSLTLLHALDAGIPTVASRVGGNVEVIRERQTGILFEKSSAADLARGVSLLAADPALRSRVSMGARNAVRELTLERMVDRLEPLLEPSP